MAAVFCSFTIASTGVEFTYLNTQNNSQLSKVSDYGAAEFYSMQSFSVYLCTLRQSYIYSEFTLHLLYQIRKIVIYKYLSMTLM